MKVSIAMTTYNGEAYVAEQFQSILSQSYQPYEIVIGDDGSTDKTVQIIEELSQKSNVQVKIIKNNPGLGFAMNFLNVLERCTGDWVCFCDQDDVWLPDKIMKAVEAVNKNPNAVLILQNSYLSNSDLEEQARLFPDKAAAGFYNERSLPGIWVWPGFLQTLRADVFQNILRLGNVTAPGVNGQGFRAHDYWVVTVANAIGGVVILKEPVALYRRHASTVTGDYTKRSVGRLIKDSFATGEAEYKKYSGLARVNADYMSWLSKKVDDQNLAKRFQVASNEYEELSDFYILRANVYSKNKRANNALSFSALLFKRFFSNTKFIDYGFKSAAKDFVSIFLYR